MTLESRLMSGSTGKMLAAPVALGLAEGGVLDLEAPLSSWFLKEPCFSRLPNANDITLRSLLNHSSGLIDHLFLKQFASALRGFTTALDNDGVFTIHPGNEWTGGGLVTNPKDMARWTRAMVTGELFGSEMLEEMLSSRSRVDPLVDYGLGVFIYKTPIEEAVGHSGWFPGYRSFVAHFVDANVTVAIQTNTANADPPLGQMAMNLANGIIDCDSGS
jgi:CubicO group peptidase (beta-lactamase class C family)